MSTGNTIRVVSNRSSATDPTKYAKRYNNGKFEYGSGFSSQAEAEEFLKSKPDNEKLKQASPYQESIPTTQVVDIPNNIPLENIKNIPTPALDDIINVVKDYDWTYSKNKIKKWDEIPYIEIKEFKLAGNSYLSSLMTSALLFPDVLESGYGEGTLASKFYKKLETEFKDNSFGKFMGAIGENANKVTQKLQKGVGEFASRITDQIKNIDTTAEAWKSITGSDDLKQKYAYLYIRESTNRKYRLPYFDKGYINIGNEFSDTYNNENELQKMAKGFSDLIQKTAGMVNLASITEPGMFIQRPKFYNFATNEFSIDINFYLFNTISPDAYIKNLELITKLVIQNTPHRHNRILVDPSCIYELLVPGRGFYPYAYISKLEVTHEGTRRVIDVKARETIVPEAFKISITLKSLTNDVNNFMIPEMGRAGIDVSKKYNALNNPVTDSANKTTIEVTSPQTGSSGPVSIIDKSTGAKTTTFTQAGFLPNVKTS